MKMSKRKALLATVVVLVGGAVVAAPFVDSAVREAAEQRVAVELAGSMDATGGVAVQVRGGWFVPQVLRGHFDEVRVVARGVPAAGVRLDEVEATLTGIALPLREVLEGKVQRLEAASATSTAVLSYTALDSLLAQQGVPLQVALDGDTLRVSGTSQVLGQDVPLSAPVDLAVQEGGVHAVPRQLDSNSDLLDRLPPSEMAGLKEKMTFEVPLGDLPLSQKLKGVELGPGGLVLPMAGSPVVLG